MAIAVDVTTISGRRVSFEVDVSTSAQSLAERARRALELAAGDSSVHLAFLWTIRSLDQPISKQAIV